VIDFKVGQKVGFDVTGTSYCYGRVLAVADKEYAVAVEPGHVVWLLKEECWRDDD
jgi:hypothetical protein